MSLYRKGFRQADFIRVAMVQDQEVTAEALHRIVAVLS